MNFIQIGTTMYSIISKVLYKRYQTKLSNFENEFVNQLIQSRIEKLGCKTFDDYEQQFVSDSEESAILNEALKVTYSEFFRNRFTFSMLEHSILPELMQGNSMKPSSELRFWSAACAAGQEAYSLAVLMEELLPSFPSKIKYRIFATDISESVLMEASNAVYPMQAMRNVMLGRIDKWFIREKDGYTVVPEIKGHVNFSEFDLLDPELDCPPVSIFGSFDLIFCANLLFYYKKSVQKIILDKIMNCLNLKAYLVSGEAERDILTRYGLKEVYQGSAIFKK